MPYQAVNYTNQKSRDHEMPIGEALKPPRGTGKFHPSLSPDKIDTSWQSISFYWYASYMRKKRTTQGILWTHESYYIHCKGITRLGRVLIEPTGAPEAYTEHAPHTHWKRAKVGHCTAQNRIVLYGPLSILPNENIWMLATQCRSSSTPTTDI